MLCIGSAVLAAASGGTPARAEVVNCHVSTDRAVDSWSCQTIVDSLSKFGMTDEEKCIALWEYVFRSMYHHPGAWDRHPADQRRDWTLDGLKLLNVYGFCLCTSYAVTLGALFETAGYPAEVVHFHDGGHTIVQVQYDGAWHAFDPMMGWYVYRQGKEGIASLDDIKNDPSIMLNAAAEGRASTPFCPCGDEPQWLAEGAATWQSYGPGSVNKPAWTSDYRLRPGETLTRLWDNRGVFWSPRTPQGGMPVHSCGMRRDQACPQFAAQWGPYVKQLENRDICRYWGNSELVYEPDLSKESCLQGLVGQSNIAWQRDDGKEAAIHVADVGQPASIVWRVASQYCLADVTLDVTITRKDAGDSVEVSVSTDAGATWRSLGKVDHTGTEHFAQRITSSVAGCYAYQVKFDLRADGDPTDAGLADLKLTNIVMASFQVLPRLEPGENKITVQVDNPDALAQERLFVEYAWYEGDELKSDRQVIDESPHEYTITVGGDALPKMQHLATGVEA